MKNNKADSKKTIVSNIPKFSLELVNYNGKDLLNKIGEDVIRNVVYSILCGENVRDLTESLTQRRLLLMNASLFVTYIKSLNNISDFTKNLSHLVVDELKTKKLSNAEKRYLYWFLGITGKAFQNVVRTEDNLNEYITRLDDNLGKIADVVVNEVGNIDININYDNCGYLIRWPSLLRCMLALGAQTLTIRGSEKYAYGKLFEKMVLGSVLDILGGEYIIKDDFTRNFMVYWLSEREDKRESDATLLLKPGSGIRFDIGFIGKGNSEISLDKVTRFEHLMERGGVQYNQTTIIIVDSLGNGSRTARMAENIGGHIIQMSCTYWVYELANVIKIEFPFYKNPFEGMSEKQSLELIKQKMQNINLGIFLDIN